MSQLLLALEQALRSLEHMGLPVDPSLSVRDAVAKELIPWLLGYRDPVHERFEARQRAQASE